jgi:arginine deiminase
MNIRKILILSLFGLTCLSGLILPAAAEVKDQAGRVVSDIDPLQSVIILSPSKDERKEVYNLYEDSPFVLLNYLDGMVQQHGTLSNLLKKNGVRVLNVIDLLNDAISNARNMGMLESALAEIFPDQFLRLKDMLSQITASVMLGRDPGFFFNYNEKGGLDPLIPLSGAFFYTRDFAVSTPRGILITNSAVKWRKHEHLLGRFLFRCADELKAHPIVFDAEAEGVHCEGGDIIVKDENTILMGIGNFSEREAAIRIAQKLNLDVVGVSMPPREAFSGVNFEIMHLDTVLSFVDEKKVLTVAYFFLKKYDVDNPVVKYLQAVHNRPKKEPEKGELEWPSSLKMAVESIPKVGWLTHFKAGTGEARELGTKLGDYLMEQGYEIIPVGGDRGDLREDYYIDDRVLYELSLQAANVVQLGPGKVLAYAHNKYTNEALRKRGVKVLAFEGKYLADSLGGPHCLTMPLVRKSNPD